MLLVVLLTAASEPTAILIEIPWQAASILACWAAAVVASALNVPVLAVHVLVLSILMFFK